MKKILIIALTMIAFSTANAETHATTEVSKTTAPASAQATEVNTPIAAPTAVAPDNSARFVGTNDLNISLLREGIKRA